MEFGSGNKPVKPCARKLDFLSFDSEPFFLQTLVQWINSTLKPEHIVVQSLEEDLYDGLVLHHLLCEFSRVNQSRLESPRLPVFWHTSSSD